MPKPFATLATPTKVLRFALFGFASVLLLFATGCVSQKPLPYQFSAAKSAPSVAPRLVVKPTVSLRSPTNDMMCKVLAVPACLDPVLVTELGNSGMFGSVELQTTNSVLANAFVLQASLTDLRWEVPHYDRILTTSFCVGLCTGIIGGVIYGNTDTDVLGYSGLRFVVTAPESSSALLDRSYTGSTKVNKVKFSCDTPDTYREVAAGALKAAIDQFQADLRVKASAAPAPQASN